MLRKFIKIVPTTITFQSQKLKYFQNLHDEIVWIYIPDQIKSVGRSVILPRSFAPVHRTININILNMIFHVM